MFHLHSHYSTFIIWKFFDYQCLFIGAVGSVQGGPKKNFTNF